MLENDAFLVGGNDELACDAHVALRRQVLPKIRQEVGNRMHIEIINMYKCKGMGYLSFGLGEVTGDLGRSRGREDLEPMAGVGGTSTWWDGTGACEMAGSSAKSILQRRAANPTHNTSVTSKLRPEES